MLRGADFLSPPELTAVMVASSACPDAFVITTRAGSGPDLPLAPGQVHAEDSAAPEDTA
jgi:hypothetical protein